MEDPILNDPNQYPDEKVIFPIIGETKSLWVSFFDYIHTNHPDFKEEWRFYKDGKSWLLKITRKAKTIFWLSLIQDGFGITFYFSDKAENDILNSELSAELKKRFKNGKHYGKIRGLTIHFNDQSAIEDAKILISLRLKF